jgi:hypothetical protein
VAEALPFMSMKYKNECSQLLKEELDKLGLINTDNRIDIDKFLNYIIE